MDTPSSPQPDAIERSKYKPRQAELALSYRRQVPAEIALDLRRARTPSNPDIRLDTFFFACLGLGKIPFCRVVHMRTEEGFNPSSASEISSSPRAVRDA